MEDGGLFGSGGILLGANLISKLISNFGGFGGRFWSILLPMRLKNRIMFDS